MSFPERYDQWNRASLWNHVGYNLSITFHPTPPPPCIIIGSDALAIDLKAKAGMFHTEMLSSEDYRIVNDDNWLLGRLSQRSDLKTAGPVRQPDDASTMT